MHRHFCLLMILLVLSAISFSGCEENVSVESEEQLRIKRLTEMREGIAGYLVVASTVAVFAGLVLAPMFEKGRSAVAKILCLSTETQVFIAKCVFFTGSLVILLFSAFDSNLAPVFPAVIIFLGGISVPFTLEYLPGLRQNDLMRRKAAMNQIKAFLMFILAMYFLMQILTPEGIFNISIKIK